MVPTKYIPIKDTDLIRWYEAFQLYDFGIITTLGQTVMFSELGFVDLT